MLNEIDARRRRELGLIPPPLAGEGWRGGTLAQILVHAPTLSLPPKAGGGPCGTPRRTWRLTLLGKFVVRTRWPMQSAS